VPLLRYRLQKQSLIGTVRSAALLTERVAHYVCYLGNGSRDRIITVRETEHGTAMSLLKVCQMYPCKEKLELQRVCQIARAELRRGVSEQTVIEALLAERRAGAAGVALAVQEGDANTCSIHVATVDEAKIVAHSEPLFPDRCLQPSTSWYDGGTALATDGSARYSATDCRLRSSRQPGTQLHG